MNYIWMPFKLAKKIEGLTFALGEYSTGPTTIVGNGWVLAIEGKHATGWPKTLYGKDLTKRILKYIDMDGYVCVYSGYPEIFNYL